MSVLHLAASRLASPRRGCFRTLGPPPPLGLAPHPSAHRGSRIASLASTPLHAVKSWTTDSFLFRSIEDDNFRPNALIILNTPLVHDELFRKLWAAADVRYCADGGANRLYDAYRTHQCHCRQGRSSSQGGDAATIQDDRVEGEEEDDLIPDLIKGDLDSLRDDVRAYYESKNVPIQHDPDQYSTDLGKCVVALTEHELASGSARRQHQLVIVGGLSGRLDQTIHTIHALTQLSETREMTWAVGGESLACVLGKGTHKIKTNLDYFGDTCGILPVGEPAKVTTSGLKWDLGPTSYAYPTSISTAVSSSNHLPQEEVTIETDVPVVWTVEVRASR